MASSSSPSAGKAGDGDGGRGRGRGNRGGRPWERSLVCVLKALRGMEVLVELQNDAVIRGSLDDCDDVMKSVSSCPLSLSLILAQFSD